MFLLKVDPFQNSAEAVSGSSRSAVPLGLRRGRGREYSPQAESYRLRFVSERKSINAEEF